jgi:putative oxidoreductase
MEEDAMFKIVPIHWTPKFLAALRIVAGLLFLAHGSVKVLGLPAGAAPGPQPIFTLLGIGGLIELIGGALIVLGLFTRPTAVVLAGEMAVAYFMFHAPKSVFPVLNGGDAAALYCFIFLYLAAAGPGAWSLDGLLESRARRDA